MIRLRYSFLSLVLATGFVCAPAPAREQAPQVGAAPARTIGEDPRETAAPQGLPAIGKWSIGADGKIAHWLGEIVDGKQLREPINVIIVDEKARSPAEAVARVTAASAGAGYPVRTGHSAGYRAVIGGTIFPQIPSGRDLAFSNRVYVMNNSHGRLFGPFAFGGGYLFTGAFSRELVRVTGQPHHAYGSFNQARDDYGRNLDRKAEFKLAGFVNLDNAIVGNPNVGTGDHDGVAVLLRAER